MLWQTCYDIAVIGAPSQDWNGTNTVSPDRQKDVFCADLLRNRVAFVTAFSTPTFAPSSGLACDAPPGCSKRSKRELCAFPAAEWRSRATFERSRFQKIWPPNCQLDQKETLLFAHFPGKQISCILCYRVTEIVHVLVCVGCQKGILKHKHIFRCIYSKV